MSTPTDKDLMADAIRVVNQAFVGLLTTVDFDAVPHSRWMGAASAADGLREIFTLTGKHTRKVEQIRKNPAVCWTFSSEDYSEVVTLHGSAQVITAPAVAQHVWDRLVECARTYCMSAMSDEDELEFVTIRTEIQQVEVLSPRRQMFKPKSISLAR